MTKIQDFIDQYNTFSNTGKSISLYKIAKTYDDSYIAFLMDYYRLPRLGLSKMINFIKYSVDEYDNEKLEIELHDVKNNFHGEIYQLLTMYKNGSYCASVSNIVGDENNPSFREFIAIDEDKIKQYIEFGKKHSQFIETYYAIKNNMLFNEYGCRLHSTLENTKDKNKFNYIQEVDSLTLSLEMDRPDEMEFAKFDFYLRDYFGHVIAHECKFDKEYMKIDGNNTDYIINNIYFDGDKLPSLFRQQKRTRKKEVK